MRWLQTWVLMLVLAGVALPSCAQVIQTVYSFSNTNGSHPNGLILGADGNFYGTTLYGGIADTNYTSGMGTVYMLTTNWVLTSLVDFDETNGALPGATLALGEDGNYYGTTEAGGDAGTNLGTVFMITPEGALTTLISFNGTNGASPAAALTLGNDGNFYGTTAIGGTNDAGTVFSTTIYGDLTPLYSFAGTNGAYPIAALTLASDGSFFGTTKLGGLTNSSATYGGGTLFNLTTAGALSTLSDFRYTNSPGGYPVSSVILDEYGNLYGTTAYGGTAGGGAVYELNTNDVLSGVAYFTSASGNVPQGTLVLGADGAFYGTASYGGAFATNGAIFRVTTNGSLKTLASFAYTNGSYPLAGLTLGNDGRLYGTTAFGGANGYGTVFRLLLPPFITTQPVSQTNFIGATVNFTVAASSLLPYTYQWLKNGTNLTDGGNSSGSATSTLTVSSISDSDVGSYSVLLSNADLSVTSTSAALVVVNPPGFAAQPAGFLLPTGSNVTFSVSLTGTAPFHYQWQFNGTNLAKATNSTFYLASVSSNNAGYYSLIVTNLAGQATSSNMSLDVLVLPKSQTNAAGANVSFAVTAFGPDTEDFQWEKNGTNLVDGGNISGATNAVLGIGIVSDTDAATYGVLITNAVGSVTNVSVNLVVVDPPVFVIQPTNNVVLVGGTASFGAALSGSSNYFRCHWQFNGTNVNGATNTTYSLAGITTNKAGIYTLVVTNLAGTAVSSNGALTVVVSPLSRTNHSSSVASITAPAYSSVPLYYQWQFNGTNLVDGGTISGSTNGTLVINGVLDANAGVYNAVVGDGSTSVTTSNLSLAVNDTLMIATQPQSQTVGIGSNVTFSVMAYGVPPFIFQWYYSNSAVGSPVSGTNVAYYSLNNVQTNMSGIYHVLILNGAGNLTSSNAVLTVKPFAPNISQQPVGQRVVLGATASFSVAANGTPPMYYQWRFNGTNIFGATNLAYVLASVVSNNTGYYSVAVTNVAGGTTSSNTLLTVLIPPTVSMQFVAGYPVIYLNGMLSNSFQVQCSTNLATTNWITLLTLTNLLTTPYEFLDPAGTGQPIRVYRAVMH